MKKTAALLLALVLALSLTLVVFADNSDLIVYVTGSGKKYHNAGCSSLGENSKEITLAEAAGKGYTPCSKCNPPVLDTSADAPAVTADAAASAAATDGADTPAPARKGMNPWLSFAIGVVVGVVAITVIRNKFGDKIMAAVDGKQEEE